MTRVATFQHLLDRARAVRVEEEIARRRIKLKGNIDRFGPCPVSGGVDRFSINIRKQVFLCSGCSKAGDVIAMVQHLDGCTFKQAVETLSGDAPRPMAPPPLKRDLTTAEYERHQHHKAAWLWSQRCPLAGTIAETYLRHRGIKLD